jgi:hypothetical protein
MEIMTIPATPWASLPSYAPSCAGSAGTAFHVTGSAVCAPGTDVDLTRTAPLGTGLVGHTTAFRIKDTRPGLRAWSPPV